MKQQFKEINLRPASMALVKQCNAIIAAYQKQRLRLTLRQLYYQLVTRNTITNTERSYQNLSTLLSNAREEEDKQRLRDSVAQLVED